MAVRLKDLAEKAGVSVSTVSRVINKDNSRPVSKKTQSMIWKIATELGYIPNQSARNLVKGEINEIKTKTIGCILASSIDTYNDPFFGEMLMGVQTEATNMGYTMGYTYSLREMSWESFINNIVTFNVDGVIVMGRFNTEVLKLLQKNFKNIVYAGLNHVNRAFDEVICDGFECAERAVEHLISLEYKSIGYIGTVTGINGVDILNEHRYSGYEEAMAKHGLKIDKRFVRHCELSMEKAYITANEMLKGGNIPRAIFCANDYVAIGAIKAIRENNLKVPNDIATISIDDIEMASYSRPLLTTIRVPKQEIGKYAVKILVDKIENKSKMPVRISLPYELVIRESCGKYLSIK